ncbi:MAG TPA: DUF2911 domain-containing protein [Terriglobales bacterium]|nr:DUF2911 domain-containing protein [Terriglobales bacterium]
MLDYMTRVLLLLFGLVPFTQAQSFVMDLPLASQHAILTQRIGITDITIDYHRPLVNGRKVWGGLVPYGQVWRAGANENTTIEFTSPVMIEGQPLAAGRYGLHMIPGENEWVVIFSKMSTAWGSFSYDQAEDALRVQVKPQTTEMHDALTYDFDEPKADSAVATLRWEKVAVPFKIGVNVNEVVESSLQRQLRGLQQYNWMSWNDSANYLLASKVDLDQALKYANKSIENEDRFDNEITKSQVLAAMGQKEDAQATEDKALAMATPLQVHMFARGLQGQGQQDKAFQIFRTNAQKHPDEWFIHSGLARIACAQGNYTDAAKEMKLALAAAPADQKTYVESLVKRLEAKDDINK